MEITQQDVTDLQITAAQAAGNLKYHGLLRRDWDVVCCRLCPEGYQLDFKDPEEAQLRIVSRTSYILILDS
jgi:hypothetical protein